MRWSVLVALAGCGRLDFDPRGDATAAPTGDAVIDAVSLGTGPFGAPTEIPMPNQSISIDDPSETGDGLELFVNVGPQVWVSVRASTADPWPLPTQLTGLPATTYSPHIAADGLTLWSVNAMLNLEYFTRATRTSPWVGPTVIAELMTASPDDGPMVTGDGLTMVFDSNRSGSPTKIFITNRATTSDPWGAPAALAIATPQPLVRPHLSEDRLRLYVQANGDIYHVERASISAAWSAPAVLDVSGPTNDDDPWLSLDEHRILFASTRGADTFGNIYEATR